MHDLSWLTSLVRLILPNPTPPLMLVLELFSSPRLIALSTTRIARLVDYDVVVYYSPIVRRNSHINIAKITFLRHGLPMRLI